MSWIVKALLAMGVFAIMIIVLSEQIKRGVSVAAQLFIMSIVWFFAFGLWLAFDKWQGMANLSAKDLIMIIVVSLLAVVGNWAQFEAAASAPNAGLSSAIVNCSTVLVAIISFFFLGGHLNWQQVVGLCLTLSGLTLLAIYS